MTFELGEAVAVLRRTPSVLSALLGGLPAVWTTAHEGAGTWSPFDVVGHLIHGEETDWIPRARIVLAQGVDRTFAPFDREAQAAANVGRPLDALLATFARRRDESLTALEGFRLTERELALRGVHPAFGEVTLRQLLATWVAHDLGHLAQISRAMAKRYRDDVGPWRAYLPVMDR